MSMKALQEQRVDLQNQMDAILDTATNIDFTVTFVDSSATPFGNLSGGTTLLTTTLPFIFVTAMSWWTGDGRAVIPNRNYTITNSNICKILFAQSNNDASATSVQGAIKVVGKWK